MKNITFISIISNNFRTQYKIDFLKSTLELPILPPRQFNSPVSPNHHSVSAVTVCHQPSASATIAPLSYNVVFKFVLIGKDPRLYCQMSPTFSTFAKLEGKDPRS